MGLRFGLAPLDYTPTIVGSAAANRPVTNVKDYLHQLRTFRSATTSANDKTVTCTFAGGAKTVTHFQLNNCNFTSLTVTPGGSPAFTIAKNRPNGRYQIWGAITTPTSSASIVLTPNTPVGGASFFEIGSAAFFATGGFVELVQGPAWPKQYTIHQAVTRTGFASGGEDVNADGEKFVEMTFHNDFWRRDNGVQAQLFDILDVGMASPIFVHENLGDSSAAWVTRRVNDPEFREQYSVFATELTLREAI